jgi:transcription antitermination factor NusG
MRQHPPVTRLTRERLTSPVWHILNVFSGQEAKQRDRLNLAGIHIAYPTREVVWRDRQNKTHRKEVPEVAGYLFAKFTHQPNWSELRARRIITGVVSKATEWGPVPYVATEDDVRVFMGMPTVSEQLEAERREALRVHPGDRARVLLGDDVALAVNVVDVIADVIYWETREGFKGRSASGNVERVAAE